MTLAYGPHNFGETRSLGCRIVLALLVVLFLYL